MNMCGNYPWNRQNICAATIFKYSKILHGMGHAMPLSTFALIFDTNIASFIHKTRCVL